MRMIALLSGIQVDKPSELSVKGKCRKFSSRLSGAATSAMYDVKWPTHFRKAYFLPSAVMLRPLMQKPDQLVNCLASRVGLPVRSSSGMSQKLHELPEDSDFE